MRCFGVLETSGAEHLLYRAPKAKGGGKVMEQLRLFTPEPEDYLRELVARRELAAHLAGGCMINELNDYQSKLQAWMLWDSQSSMYKLTHPEPPKPTTATTLLEGSTDE